LLLQDSGTLPLLQAAGHLLYIANVAAKWQ